ncbi:hypothetical protein N9D23_07370 [Rubripirellula sp.]|nr:hypothetical protein [Rubripirellula sp.]
MSCDPAVLIQQINKLQYLEYTNIGWMKAELLNVEALGSQLPSTASVGLPALLDRFHCDLDDSAIHRELIAFFLENWVCYQTPESSCAWWWHEDISRYQPVTRSTAVEMIDAMIAVSGGARKKWIEGEWWPEEKSRKETIRRRLRAACRHFHQSAIRVFLLLRPVFIEEAKET